jgi:hypothetical protein
LSPIVPLLCSTLLLPPAQFTPVPLHRPPPSSRYPRPTDWNTTSTSTPLSAATALHRMLALAAALPATMMPGARRSPTRSLQHSTQLPSAMCTPMAELSPSSPLKRPLATPLDARLPPHQRCCRALQLRCFDKPHSATSASCATSHCQPSPGFVQHVCAPDVVPSMCPCDSACLITVFPLRSPIKRGMCIICPPHRRPLSTIGKPCPRLPCSFFPQSSVASSHRCLFLLNDRSRSTTHPQSSSPAPQPHRPSTRAFVRHVHHHRSALFGELMRLKLPPSFFYCGTPVMPSSSCRICLGSPQTTSSLDACRNALHRH